MRVGALLLLLATAPPICAQQLRIYHIDVDQGESTLFVAPTGETLLIDSGNHGDGDVVRGVLQRAGATQIDHHVTTHYHSDHYGGIDELFGSPAIPIVKAYDRGDKGSLGSKLTETRYIQYDTTVGSGATHIMRGETIQFGAVTATCIASGGVVLGEPDPTQPGHDENDKSVALLIEWQGFRHFVGGDIESFTEQKIADLDAVLDVDVYLANHHGSHTSSSSAFLRDLEPTVVVISNGDNSGHQHPRQITLDTLAQLPGPPTIYQTNRYTKGGDGGNVLLDFVADLTPGGDDGTIEIAVDRGADEYTVSFGTSSWTFPIKDRGPQGQRVVIESLLPDPVGNDRQLEEVTIRNDGPGPVDFTGWVLQDDRGRRWPLTELGSLAAGSSATSVRAGLPLNLHNAQETVELIDPLGAVRDEFSYSGTQEGVRIVTGH